jgi:hypothetical protein
MKRLRSKVTLTLGLLLALFHPIQTAFADGVGSGCGTKIVNGQRVACSCSELCKPYASASSDEISAAFLGALASIASMLL